MRWHISIATTPLQLSQLSSLFLNAYSPSCVSPFSLLWYKVFLAGHNRSFFLPPLQTPSVVTYTRLLVLLNVFTFKSPLGSTPRGFMTRQPLPSRTLQTRATLLKVFCCPSFPSVLRVYSPSCCRVFKAWHGLSYSPSSFKNDFIYTNH